MRFNLQYKVIMISRAIHEAIEALKIWGELTVNF